MTVAADAFLDTNVLVYAIDSRSKFQNAARDVLDSAERVYAISPQIVFEFLSVVTNPKRGRSPLSPEKAHDAMRILLA